MSELIALIPSFSTLWMGLKFLFLDIIEEYRFYEYHHFNYSSKVDKVLTFVGSVNRNKLIPFYIKPLYQLYRDQLSPFDQAYLRRYEPYTPTVYQLKQNQPVYFIATAQSLYIWNLIAFSAMYGLLVFLYFFIFKQLDLTVGLKNTFRGSFLVFFIIPHIHFLSFECFYQLSHLTILNWRDKGNMLVTVIVLWVTMVVAFCSMFIMRLLNSKKSCKVLYGKKLKPKEIMISLISVSVKYFLLGFITAFLNDFNLQVILIICVYATEIYCCSLSKTLFKGFFSLTKAISIIFCATSWMRNN